MSNENPKPDSALKRLDAFAGTWKTEGEIKAIDGYPAVPVEGTDIYEWLPGGNFLIHKVDVRMGDEQVYTTEIIGYDASTGTYVMHYFDHQGNSGKMAASVDSDIWTFIGETERFTGSFNEAGDVISGKWKRLDGDEWVDWMEITLSRIT